MDSMEEFVLAETDESLGRLNCFLLLLDEVVVVVVVAQSLFLVLR